MVGEIDSLSGPPLVKSTRSTVFFDGREESSSLILDNFLSAPSSSQSKSSLLLPITLYAKGQACNVCVCVCAGGVVPRTLFDVFDYLLFFLRV